MPKIIKINPNERKLIITNYRLDGDKFSGSVYLIFDIYYIIDFSGQTDKIFIKNNLAWRGFKGPIMWRTAHNNFKGHRYFSTQVSASLYTKIQNYLEQEFGKVLTKRPPPKQRRKDSDSPEEAIGKFLEKEN